jgi:hypothetical protein
MPGNAGRGGGSTQVYALGLIVLVAGSFLAFTVFFPGPLPFGSGSGQKSFLSTCIEHSAVDAHYHATLKIFVDDIPFIVPLNVGISPNCMHPLHTHAEDGLIHMELVNGLPTPTLGDFFDIWGQPLTNSEVLSYSGNFTVSVNASPYTGEYRGIVLFDTQRIDIRVNP